MTDKQIIIYKKECYNEPHCSLNQVLEQLNAYKMEADEGKEINAELKAENEELKNRVAELSLFQLYKIQRDEAEQTLAEIKEIVEHCINQDICTFCDYSDRCYIEDEEIPTYDVCKLILQKISECEE